MMQISEKTEKKYRGLRWTVYFPEDAAADKEKILAGLKNKGFEAVPAEHLWKGEMRKMFDVSWEAIVYLEAAFPVRSHARIFLRLEGVRGWLALEEEGGGRFGTNNNTLFGGRRGYLTRFR